MTSPAVLSNVLVRAPWLRPLVARADALLLGVIVIATFFLPGGLPLGIVGLGVVSGAAIATQALGIVLLYRATRILNFAQLAYGLIAAVWFYQLVKHVELVVLLQAACHCVPGIATTGPHASFYWLQNHPFDVVRALRKDHLAWLYTINFVLSALFALAIGVNPARQMHRWVTRFWSTTPRLVPTVASLGLATVLAFAASTFSQVKAAFIFIQIGPVTIDENPMFNWWPFDDYHGIQGFFQAPYGDLNFGVPFDTSHAHFHTADVLYVVLAVGATVAIALLLKYTSLGIVLRGVADNQERAQTLGINTSRALSRVWWIGALLSCLVALVATTTGPPDVSSALNLETLTRVLTVFVFARMASIWLTLYAGIALAVVEQALLWSFHSHAPFFLVQLAVLAAALMLQRRKQSRAEQESAAAWLASPEIRPTPKTMRGLPLVHAWLTYAPAAGVLAVLALPFFLDAGQTTTAAVMLIYAVIGLSIFVLTGWAGQISLGQMGFAAVGAFVSVMLQSKLSIPLPAAALAGALAGAAAAVVVGIPGLRLPGPTLAVITLAIASAVSELLIQPKPPSLGSNLPASVDRPLVLGLDLNDDRVFYYVVLVVLGLTLGAVLGLRRSRLRRVLVAARDNDPAAQSFGINVVAARVEAFAISGFLAALAGALLAFESRGVSVLGFDPAIGVTMFMVTVIGGVGSVAGAVIGSLYYGFLNIAGGGWVLVGVGAGLITLLQFFRAGLGGAIFAARDAILRRMAVRNRIAAPSLLGDFTATASGMLRARIVPKRGRDGAEELIDTRFELLGEGPGPVAGTYLSSDGASTAGDSDGQPGTLGEATADALLRCRELDVRYDAVQALFDVDFDVSAGEIVALIGTNGAGKTTLLRTLAGLHKPSGGRIVYGDADVTRTEPHVMARRGVALVPGGAGVFPSLTVAENLRAARLAVSAPAADVGTIRTLRRKGPALRRVDVSDADVEQVLALFPRLRERLGAQAGNLSGGEQQMLALAQAFLVKPRVLLIDELSMGLAPSVVQTILDVLRGLRDAGTAIVIVEQSVNVSATVADRAVVLEKGEVRYRGPAAELLDHPELFQSISFGTGGGVVGGTSELRRRQKELGEADELVLEVSDVRASYGGVLAVGGVSLTVQAGEIVGLIGPNGAGKTTLFDVITGFMAADSGSVAVLGSDVTRLQPYQRAGLGLMRSFQNVRLFGSLTVRDNIAVALERHLHWKQGAAHALWLPMARQAEGKAQARVDMLIELLGLEAHAGRVLAEISIGTRRIVDIACQLAARPRVLLLDEPSSGLPQIETEQLGPIIARIAKDLDAGLLVVEHDIPLVSAISDRLVAMDLGLVIAEGSPREVLADARVRDSYFGGAAQAVAARSGAGVALPA